VTLFLKMVTVLSLIGLSPMLHANKEASRKNAESGTLKFHRFSGRHMLLCKTHKCVGGPFVAKDAKSGKHLHFVFVDNLSLSAQGSYENPYPTLAMAEAHSKPSDIIYVFPGDGTTTGMDSGIVLQHQQKLWGSAKTQSVQTSKGTVIIPKLTSVVPTISNTAGHGITLATNNSISGFTIEDSTANGIFGDNPENINISSCVINNSQLDQISLTYNLTSGVINIDNLTINNSNQKALFINSTVSRSMALIVNNSTIQASAADSIDASFSDEVSVELTNNTFASNAYSSTLSFAGPSTLFVSANSFTSNSSINMAPLFVNAFANKLLAIIDSNIISANTTGALRFILSDSQSDLTITNNTISNNGIGAIGSMGSAIFIDPNNSTIGSLNLILNNNIISDNTGNALFTYNGSFNDVQISATDNSVTGNGGGAFVFANACNTFTLNASNNTISDGGDHGISTGGNLSIATAHMTLSNNHITGNSNFASGVALSHSGNDLYCPKFGRKTPGFQPVASADIAIECSIIVKVATVPTIAPITSYG
jgi:hypothetical protein